MLRLLDLCKWPIGTQKLNNVLLLKLNQKLYILLKIFKTLNLINSYIDLLLLDILIIFKNYIV